MCTTFRFVYFGFCFASEFVSQNLEWKIEKHYNRNIFTFTVFWIHSWFWLENVDEK